MWLLNARTRKLEEFHGSNTPKYAILSHRWEDQEVTFADLSNTPDHLKGWHKIDMSCRRALSHGTKVYADEDVQPLEYIWIDTCCINKNSSTELSEAINSMYKWYANAEVCYAYLYDTDDINVLSGSSWFLRGWTLQELLAPRHIIFFDKAWSPMGSKFECSNDSEHRGYCDDDCMISPLSRITKIPTQALRKFEPDRYSIAQRMSWMAMRTTTREEDIAYCLLGIFRINMPLLYGEGDAAFTRLQEEIMRVSNDLSIFIWSGLSSVSFGMLARSPSCFKFSVDQDRDVMAIRRLSSGFVLNNTGVLVKLKVQPLSGRDILVAHLDETSAEPPYRTVGIFLKKSDRTGIYHRISVEGISYSWFATGTVSPLPRSLQISRDASIDCRLIHTNLIFPQLPRGLNLYKRTAVARSSHPGWELQQSANSDGEERDMMTKVTANPGETHGFICQLSAEVVYPLTLTIFLGFDAEFSPICLLQFDWTKMRRPTPDTNQRLLDNYYDLKQMDTARRRAAGKRFGRLVAVLPLYKQGASSDDYLPLIEFEPREESDYIRLNWPLDHSSNPRLVGDFILTPYATQVRRRAIGRDTFVLPLMYVLGVNISQFNEGTSSILNPVMSAFQTNEAETSVNEVSGVIARKFVLTMLPIEFLILFEVWLFVIGEDQPGVGIRIAIIVCYLVMMCYTVLMWAF